MKYLKQIQLGHFIFIALLAMVWVCYDIVRPNQIYHFTWWPQWITITGLIVLYGGYWVKRKTNWIAALCFVYTAYSSLWVCIFRLNQYRGLKGEIRQELYYSTFYALVTFVAITLFALTLDSKSRHWLAKGFGALCLINAVFTLIQWPVDGYAGLINYPGMNGCFLAMTIPFLFKLFRNPYAIGFTIVPVVAIVLSGSSMAYGCLAAVIVTYLIFRRGPILYRALGLLTIPGLYFLGSYLQGRFFLFSSGRFEMYEHLWKYLTGPGQQVFNWFTGTGNGTFVYIGQLISRPFNGQTWLWLHSDAFQTLFELGFIGLGLYCILFLCVGWNFRKNVGYLCSLSAWLACALFNYPVHLAPTALLGAFLVIEGLSEPERAQKKNNRRRQWPRNRRGGTPRKHTDRLQSGGHKFPIHGA